MIDWKAKYLEADAERERLERALATERGRLAPAVPRIVDVELESRLTELVEQYNRIFAILRSHGLETYGRTQGSVLVWYYKLHGVEYGDYVDEWAALNALIAHVAGQSLIEM